MFTAEEPVEFERLIADMAKVGCVVTWSEKCVWISGNTFPIRDILKKNGWKWSAKKKTWWSPIGKWINHGELYYTMKEHTEFDPDNVWNDLDYALGY